MLAVGGSYGGDGVVPLTVIGREIGVSEDLPDGRKGREIAGAGSAVEGVAGCEIHSSPRQLNIATGLRRYGELRRRI